MKLIKLLPTLILFGLFLQNCSSSDNKTVNLSPSESNADSRFELLSPEESGVKFNNNINETVNFNHLVWESVYYGGGVAIGDVNNDGLPDIYFAGNQVPDALYLNKGNLEFEDVSQSSIIGKFDGWSSGVSMVDINEDGWTDIYVCKSWWNIDRNDEEKRRNLLFINQKDGTFKEEAQRYGLADQGHSTVATFFDYDNDGDLDMYLLNTPSNNFKQKLAYMEVNEIPYTFSDKLFRNDGNEIFSDQTKAAGVESYSFGMGVVASDVNQDGYMDLYIANDYEKPDRYLINQGNGTFKDNLSRQFKHTSYSSMGTDIADMNNDGFMDIMVVDMQSSDHYRSKTNMGSMSTETFWNNVKQGYHYQFMSNVLQLNRGAGYFSDIGQLAGISSTDWSWSILAADFDNDTYKDLYITNGINKDIQNNDFIEMVKSLNPDDVAYEDFVELAKKAPTQKVSNHFYKNKGDLSFENTSKAYGLEHPGFSFGAAYADLDLDGDLELIVNNNNEVAHIYKNNNIDGNHFLQIKVKGTAKNPEGIGTTARIYYDGKEQMQELSPARGFQSSSELLLHFGLGQIDQLDSILVRFPNGQVHRALNVKANQRLTLDMAQGQGYVFKSPFDRQRPFAELTNQLGIQFTHTENDFDDFGRELLLPHMQSRNGPKVAVADVNGDGRADFYVGGASGQSGALYLQTEKGPFELAPSQPWEFAKPVEEMGCHFFDADGDQDLDLYIVSGGHEFNEPNAKYQDQYYINEGNGKFRSAPSRLEKLPYNGSCVTSADYDNDGDLDLFVGGRGVPGSYPDAGHSFILSNVNGKFIDRTPEIIKRCGMVTDAEWTDFNGDGQIDLVVIGEWMHPTFFKNDKGNFTDVSEEWGIKDMNGWWFDIKAADFDGDGDVDFLVGNMGNNNKYHPSKKKPLEIYATDFDGNRTHDVVLAKYYDDKLVPVRGRQCSSEQVPEITAKFVDYESFASASLDDIYNSDKLEKSIKQVVTEFRSGILENKGGQFEFHALPNIAQVSPVMASLFFDVNKDGHKDLVLSGNHFDAEVETARHDAGVGLVLLGNGSFEFTEMPLLDSGFYTPSNVKDMALMDNYQNGNKLILVAVNNNRLKAILWKK